MVLNQLSCLRLLLSPFRLDAYQANSKKLIALFPQACFRLDFFRFTNAVIDFCVWFNVWQADIFCIYVFVCKEGSWILFLRFLIFQNCMYSLWAKFHIDSGGLTSQEIQIAYRMYYINYLLNGELIELPRVILNAAIFMSLDI